jgi:hypothetical protein
MKTPIAVVAVMTTLIVGVSPQSALAQPAPKGPVLPHFACYIAQEAKHPTPLFVIKDQFGEHRSRVRELKFLCAPVASKELIGTKPLQPVGALDHLACYLVAPSNNTSKKGVSNQLDKQNFTIGSLALLCVPSFKGQPFDQPPPKG